VYMLAQGNVVIAGAINVGASTNEYEAHRLRLYASQNQHKDQWHLFVWVCRPDKSSLSGFSTEQMTQLIAW
jgi:hypothetical protein